jgi:amino acid transporter
MADDPRLSQEQIDRLIAQIDRLERKRKLMLAGYLTALGVLVVGQGTALVIFATAPPGQFVGWVFFIPFALVGVVLLGFGRLAGRPRRRDHLNRPGVRT